MTPYDVTHLDELERVPVGEDGLAWRPVRRRLGIGAFGVNAHTAEAAGQEVIEDHTETSNRHEELYVVLTGHACFSLGEEHVEAPAGTFVFIRDPELQRSAKACEPGTTVLALGGRPGKAFQPSAWEHWFIAYGQHRAEPERAIAELEAGLAQHPDHPTMLYHLACFESRAGRAAAALEHLQRAVDLDGQLRAWARDDEDFSGLRDDPRFVSAIAGEPDADGPSS